LAYFVNCVNLAQQLQLPTGFSSCRCGGAYLWNDFPTEVTSAHHSQSLGNG